VQRTAETGGEGLSDWERQFLTEVQGRLEQYGSAFANLSKGDKDDALSRLQTVKLKEMRAKVRKAMRARRAKPPEGE
jgi:hypothetical protein